MHAAPTVALGDLQELLYANAVVLRRALQDTLRPCVRAGTKGPPEGRGVYTLFFCNTEPRCARCRYYPGQPANRSRAYLRCRMRARQGRKERYLRGGRNVLRSEAWHSIAWHSYSQLRRHLGKRVCLHLDRLCIFFPPTRERATRLSATTPLSNAKTIPGTRAPASDQIKRQATRRLYVCCYQNSPLPSSEAAMILVPRRTCTSRSPAASGFPSSYAAFRTISTAS